MCKSTIPIKNSQIRRTGVCYSGRMIRAAKLLMIDPSDNYLMMFRSDHPYFGVDPDLPGGALQEDESLLEGMLREVFEETGIKLGASQVSEVYSGTEYSIHGIHYALFVAQLDQRPKITVSWEHQSYEWLNRDEFMKKSCAATDEYMHMVAAMMKIHR